MTAQEQYPTYTATTLVPASRPTFYFIGVSTAGSSIRQVFPKWADELDLGDVDFVGIDMPLHAPAEDYRRVVQFFRDDDLSIGALVTTHKLDLYQAAALGAFKAAMRILGLIDEDRCAPPSVLFNEADRKQVEEILRLHGPNRTEHADPASTFQVPGPKIAS